MKRTLASLEGSRLDGQRALVRVDFNVPVKDGRVSDDTRIRAALPTITYLRDKGARVVLLSHFGRPKGGPDPKFSLKQLVLPFEKLLGSPITFLEDPLSDAAPAQGRRMPRGSVVLAENTRFFPGGKPTIRRWPSALPPSAMSTSTTPSARPIGPTPAPKGWPIWSSRRSPAF